MDSDADGLADNSDKCPGTPRGAGVDASGCELDTDGDGVVDRKDRCPDTSKGEKIDSVGCSLALQGARFRAPPSASTIVPLPGARWSRNFRTI